MAEDVDDNDPADELTISPKKAFFIIVKAREFDEEVAPTDPDSGSNPDRRSRGRCAREPAR